MPSTIIRCRAKINPDCYDGKPSLRQFGYDAPLQEDGTFWQETIICDPCYIHLMPYTPSGRGLREELKGESLDAAIAAAKGQSA